MFLEKIIEKLSREKASRLAENLFIEIGRIDIIKKKLLNALSSEAFLVKSASSFIEDFRELMREMFYKGGKGEFPSQYASLVEEVEKKGLAYYINKEHTQILIPFEFYFVPDFFSPSYFSLLYAFQNYDESVLGLIADYLNIDDPVNSKLSLARKIYYFLIKYIEKIHSSLTPEEKKMIETIYYNKGETFWHDVFSNFIEDERGEYKDKYYIKELFFKADKSSPVFSLLLKSILIPVSDRTRLFVEELTVPSEFEQEILREYREKDKKIVCDLQDLYIQDDVISISGVEKDFKNDFRRFVYYVLTHDIKATTTKKIYFKDLKKILDNFEWGEDYFNLLWSFQKDNKVFVVDEGTKNFLLSQRGEELLRLDDLGVEERAYKFFLKHSCCSADIKEIVLKDLAKSYPCYIDVRYFVELSKKVVSELSHLVIKEDLNLDTTFFTIYYLLYNLGFAQKINVRREHFNITSIRLNSEGYFFATGERKELKVPIEEEKISVENGYLILDIDSNFDDLKLLFDSAERVSIKEKIRIKIKDTEFSPLIDRIDDKLLREKLEILSQKNRVIESSSFSNSSDAIE